ncbi:restriction endonuclease PLD domain-containing protein [Mucilaginibacter kameinonensis]|uniref:restriction endonuclease PLD domain-containing protein n=1 Tax=Mucilaginibacter kameinonensis TaxID=452286 RepID=UPI000EF7926C|nr:restriction endonuclease PLD domain-containing protein [Mucilaginibacter kameinonensis]
MELLLSNFQPAFFPDFNTSRSYFETALRDCADLKIASGYISSDSLMDLKRVIELNKRPTLELLIGMHYFDGFTENQYDAACILNDYLISNNLGGVYIADTLKFHGKMYSFIMQDATKTAIIGSSNLGSLFDNVTKQYETDFLLKGDDSIVIHTSVKEIINRIGAPLRSVTITDFLKFNKLLDNNLAVEKVDSSDLEDIKDKRTSTYFDIEIKSEEKSNLNCYFGKGRDNGRYVKPRSWYEVEIIVSSTIFKQPGYPRGETFTVFTDDGWSFRCTTNGSNYKNLRSKDDLKVLGKWIKGRLENSGALRMGGQVTNEVIAKYGRSFMRLTATTEPNIWYLDYAQ